MARDPSKKGCGGEDFVGRPSTPLLSQEAIAAAALRLVDQTGEFTIGQVAHALSVRPSSLYNHVAGKDEIVEAMRALVFREGGVDSDHTGTWDHVVRTLLRRYRACFARHPRLIPHVTAYTVTSPEVMGMYDELAQTLADAGVAEDQLLDVITMCDSVVLGAALDLAAPDQVWDVSHAHSRALIAAIEQAGSGRERSDRAFELALDLLLSGIAALIDGERVPHKD